MLKNELRQKYTQLRKEISAAKLNQISESISDTLFRNINLEHKVVSLFLPIEKNNEINTYLILEKAISIDAKVVIPKSNFETNEMKHVLFEKNTTLILNKYGIPEPEKGKVIASDKIDYVIVPLLIADDLGNRVGYGKGFYDRFLKKCHANCKFIGINHFDNFEKIEDIQASDVKLHALISPEKIYWFAKK